MFFWLIRNLRPHLCYSTCIYSRVIPALALFSNPHNHAGVSQRPNSYCSAKCPFDVFVSREVRHVWGGNSSHSDEQFKARPDDEGPLLNVISSLLIRRAATCRLCGSLQIKSFSLRTSWRPPPHMKDNNVCSIRPVSPLSSKQVETKNVLFSQWNSGKAAYCVLQGQKTSECCLC